MAYEFVCESEAKRYRSDCSNVLKETCELLKEKGISAQFSLVGSGARNMITRNGDGPYDLDYNLLVMKADNEYFDMGGCEYLESRIDATEYGELLPTVDDAVCGLISILDAMNTGDNDRFHLETLHHSKQEIRRILERGGKIDRTVEYAVDDEDEEYEQYHGFSMRM